MATENEVVIEKDKLDKLKEGMGKLKLERAGQEIAQGIEDTRQRVEALKDKISQRLLVINDEEIEPFLKDVRGASTSFLTKTSIDKVLEKRENSERRRNDPKLEDGWVTLRFRITETQRDLLNDVLDRVREIAGIQGRLWKGVALEWLCADFIAGHGGAGENDKGGYTEQQ